MRGEKDTTRITILILGILVVVMALILLYFFVVQPQIQSYSDERAVEGANFAINSILASIQSQGYVEIPISENQSLILVPYVPDQQGAQQPTEQTQ